MSVPVANLQWNEFYSQIYCAFCYLLTPHNKVQLINLILNWEFISTLFRKMSCVVYINIGIFVLNAVLKTSKTNESGEGHHFNKTKRKNTQNYRFAWYFLLLFGVFFSSKHNGRNCLSKCVLKRILMWNLLYKIFVGLLIAWMIHFHVLTQKCFLFIISMLK